MIGRRAFFAWERGLRGPTPVVFYDSIPPRDGKPLPLVASWEILGGTANADFFPGADETPNFKRLGSAFPSPVTS